MSLMKEWAQQTPIVPHYSWRTCIVTGPWGFLIPSFKRIKETFSPKALPSWPPLCFLLRCLTACPGLCRTWGCMTEKWRMSSGFTHLFTHSFIHTQIYQMADPGHGARDSYLKQTWSVHGQRTLWISEGYKQGNRQLQESVSHVLAMWCRSFWAKLRPWGEASWIRLLVWVLKGD